MCSQIKRRWVSGLRKSLGINECNKRKHQWKEKLWNKGQLVTFGVKKALNKHCVPPLTKQTKPRRVGVVTVVAKSAIATRRCSECSQSWKDRSFCLIWDFSIHLHSIYWGSLWGIKRSNTVIFMKRTHQNLLSTLNFVLQTNILQCCPKRVRVTPRANKVARGGKREKEGWEKGFHWVRFQIKRPWRIKHIGLVQQSLIFSLLLRVTFFVGGGPRPSCHP